MSFFTMCAQIIDDYCMFNESEIENFLNGNCNTSPIGDYIIYSDLDTYISRFDNEPLHNPPLKTIKLNINIFQKDDGSGNFPDNQNTRDLFNQIITWVNGIYLVCDPCDPVPGTMEIDYTNIRFSIGEVGNERIYFYQNSQIWNSIEPSVLEDEIITEYPERANFINVLISGAIGINATANPPSYTDLNQNQHVFMKYWDDPVSNYAKANQLAHELGHSLGLEHTYYPGAVCDNVDEYLSDIFGTWPGNCPHIGPPNIWFEDACEFPDDRKTNNLMGGNNSNCYISPKQSGQMHRSLSLTSARRFVEDSYSGIPLVIDYDQIWDFDIKLYRNLHITAGNTLTITCNVVMPRDGCIIVEPAAKLIIDGGKITTDSDYWQGIYVWGYHYMPQTLANQGYIKLENGAIIEKAIVGVRLYRYQYSNTQTGGIIQANNALFINNWRAVEFYKYDYMGSNNISNFSDCQFIYNDDFYLPDPPDGALCNLNDVQGVKFTRCTFANEKTDNSFFGTGIYSSNSNTLIDGKCISQVQPCNEWAPSEFKRLDIGIMSINYASNKSISIKHSLFDNNYRGIYCSNIPNAKIISNTFNINDITGGTYYERGVYMSECVNYHIEDNFFTSANNSNPTIGLYIYNSGSRPNWVHNNRFNNLFYGTIADRINKSEHGTTGLCYKCNDFSNNKFDVQVVKSDGDLGKGIYGIASNQGTYSPQGAPKDTCAAGNTFTTSGMINNFYNTQSWITYIIQQNPGVYKIEPNPRYGLTISNDLNTTFEKSQSCPSWIKESQPGGGSVGGYIAKMESNEVLIDSIEILLNELTDGGSTFDLNNEVAMSFPQDAMELREELLNKSPFLSDTVMESAIYKENVLPNAMIRDVLLANPQSAKSEELMNILDERFNPMPDYMKDEILDGQNILGAKEILETKLGEYNAGYAGAIESLLSAYIYDTTVQWPEDSVINLLNRLNTKEANYQLAMYYFANGNYTEAEQTLQQIPNMFNLSQEESNTHQDYLDYIGIIADLYSDTLGIYSLDTNTVFDLMQIAVRDYSEPGAMARNLLIAGNYITYSEPVNLADENLKSSTFRSPSESYYQHKVNGVYLNAFPVPANDFVIIEYKIDFSYTEGIISISDVMGKQIENQLIGKKQDQLIIDLRNYPSGSYIIYLTLDNKIYENIKLNIIN